MRNVWVSVLLTCLVFSAAAYTGWRYAGWRILGTNEQNVLSVVSERTATSAGWPSEPDPVSISPLTVASVFSPDHSWVAKLPVEKTVTVIATGDVLTARTVNYKMVTERGFRWPFEKTADVLSGADLTVINLETPLLSDCPPTQSGMIFCGDARATDGLIYAGVDVATLGNNHMGNHYLAGVNETIQILTNAGIAPAAEAPVYKEVKNTRFAFLSYSAVGAPEAGVPWADRDSVAADIAQARKNADIVVVAYHWGDEYVTEPTDYQIDLAHFTIDAGADVIIGNHPHWIQPVELYKDKFISYAHGNFVFDQEWSEETKLGVVGKYIFYEGKLVDVEYLPIRIVDYGQPYFLSGGEAQKVIEGMRAASERLAR